MVQRRLAALLTVALLAALAVPSLASACGEPTGPVVAHGRSPGGLPWVIHADHTRTGWTSVDFDFEPPGYSDAGYMTEFRIQRGYRLLMFGAEGSGLGPGSEGGFSGVTGANVVWVRLSLSGGRTIGFPPRAAPARLRRTRPWLRRLRFFEAFYPDRYSPRSATLYDARGRVLGRTRHPFDLVKRARASCGI